MPIVTAITTHPRHAGRFELEVDGAVAATLSLDSIERLQLVVGGSVDGMEEQIAIESARFRVRRRALNMLAARARSSVELARSLVRKGEAQAEVDTVILLLQEQGLLDDVAFAESFTRAKVLGARHSRRRVQQDLARKGVPRAVTDAAIATVFLDEAVDQRALVESVARKKLRSLEKLDPAARRRRLYAFLARRGYDADDIRRAMQAVGDALNLAVES
ncbi:MAG: recombination regulator RecX [Gemmatimonadaceae bacterium]|nr:recombination regulator RecX [Gemmatimonadaceae bacterium]